MALTVAELHTSSAKYRNNPIFILTYLYTSKTTAVPNTTTSRGHVFVGFVLFSLEKFGFGCWVPDGQINLIIID